MKSSRVNQAAADKIKSSARLYIDGLAGRLRELTELINASARFTTGQEEQYGHFKDFFQTFLDHTEECMILSSLAEETLALPEKLGLVLWAEHGELEGRYRKLQLFLLNMVTRTMTRLLKIWETRLDSGISLPYGAYEVFLLAQRVIVEVKSQLQRPRYAEEITDQIEMAAKAEDLIAEFLAQAPRFREFEAEKKPKEIKPFGEDFGAPVAIGDDDEDEEGQADEVD